jgi:hypothetical protein
MRREVPVCNTAIRNIFRRLRASHSSGEFNQVGIVGGTLSVKASRDVAHSPEWTILGQGTSIFSTLQFFPELVRTLLPVMKEQPPQVVIAHDSHFRRRRSVPSPLIFIANAPKGGVFTILWTQNSKPIPLATGENGGIRCFCFSWHGMAACGSPKRAEFQEL